MQQYLKLLLPTLLAVLIANAASAQKTIPPGQLMLPGGPVNCGPIPTLVQPIPDIAMARPGWIILNPSFFQLPYVLQYFVYAHECAHHIVGSNEAASDCWAIRTGRDQGWFKDSDIGWLVSYFGGSPGDWTHAPGPIRIANLIECFRS